jgi:hypothetical protein
MVVEGGRGGRDERESGCNLSGPTVLRVTNELWFRQSFRRSAREDVIKNCTDHAIPFGIDREDRASQLGMRLFWARKALETS